MKIGYLTNQYPARSHTFIRREILALEALGVEVERYSIRRSDSELVDSSDRKEEERTYYLLDFGQLATLWTCFTTALRHPLSTLSALRTCWRLARNSSRGSLIQLAYLAEAAVLLRLVRKHGVEHIHAHFATNSTTVAMLCERLGGPGFSFMVHGPDEFERLRDISLPEKVEAARFVTAISHFCQSQIYRWTRVDLWPKVHIVPCGVDERFLLSEPTPVPAARRLLWVGRLAEAKGLPIILDACKQLRDEGVDFELRIAGDGSMRPLVEERIAAEGLSQHVKLLGWVDDESIRVEIEKARAIVLASFAEGLPVVLMETMARGRPGIATRIAAIPELVRDGETGWLVSPGSVRELADAMRRVLDMPVSDLQSIADAARARAVERHDVRDSAEILARLLPGSMTAEPVEQRAAQ